MPDGVGAIDHLYPLMLGGVSDEEIDARANLIMPPVDSTKVFTPRTPGFPPYPHIPLHPPDFYHLLIPQLAAETQDREMLGPLRTVDRSMSEALSRAEKSPAGKDLENTGVRIDPIFSMLLYLAIGLGTLSLAITARYTILWLTLLLIGLVMSVIDREAVPVPSTDLFWGLGLGLIFSVPFLLLNWGGLRTTAALLYPYANWETLLLSLVILAPLAENLFFRGTLQEQKGFAISVAAVGLSTILFFWPALYQYPVNFIVAVLITTVFAALYSFLRSSISMVAAIACQVVLNLMIFFIPALF